MTIWTPSGEHEVPRDSGGDPRAAPPDQTSDVHASRPKSGDQTAGPPPGQPEMDPQMQQEMEQQLAEIRQRILQTPIEAMLAQHFVGLYEIAAIHMSAEVPNLHSARLAINAMDGILSATEGELGDAEESMQSMLHQLRMAFVSASQNSDGTGETADGAPDAAGADDPAPAKDPAGADPAPPTSDT